MLKIRALKLIAPAMLICLLVLPSALAQANTVTAIRCGRLINPADGSVTQNALIIEQVGANLRIPDGARMIDLSACTVLPGSGLAQKVTLETATGHEEKNHQHLSDFLGKAHPLLREVSAISAYSPLRLESYRHGTGFE